MKALSRRSPAALIRVLACGLAAAALELGLGMVPSYDPFGWLVWGRQTVHLALDPIGAPTWKPLPWLLTTPLALAGGAAPTLWLIGACAAGLAALWLAYGLGHRLGGAVGGIVAIGALLLCRNWFDYLLTGNVEPATVALVLGAAEGHERGRCRLAFVLLELAALMRPEAALLLILYGAWLWRTDRGARTLEAAGVAVLALLWFLPPYISTGVALGSHDAVFHTAGATRDPITVALRGATIVSWPVAVAALAGLAFALRRPAPERQQAVVLVAVGAGWIATTAAMAAAGFPGLQRFMLPAAGALCVLAGGGAGEAVTWGRRRLGSRCWPIAALFLLVAVIGTGFYVRLRLIAAVNAVNGERTRSELDRELSQAITEAGGRERILACGAPSVGLGFQSVLAWDLHRAVGQIGFRPGRDRRGRAQVVLFALGRQSRLGAHPLLLAHAGPWRLVALRPAPACLGTPKVGT